MNIVFFSDKKRTNKLPLENKNQKRIGPIYKVGGSIVHVGKAI